MTEIFDPFYIIQGIYGGQYGTISETDGSNSEKIARQKAKDMLNSPLFHADYVRVITRDGQFVWSSCQHKNTIVRPGMLICKVCQEQVVR